MINKFWGRKRATQVVSIGLMVCVSSTAVAYAEPPPHKPIETQSAHEEPQRVQESVQRSPGQDSVPVKDRASVLGKAWKSSKDRAWTTSGDVSGFHVLVADAASGYAWRTAATLSEPGFDADSWIGNACVTGSGTRAVVVYAPRTFTNKPELMARGAFTAVVDLISGDVTKLQLQVSLSYYNPGCGADESAVLTQGGGEDKGATRLVRVDAVTASLAEPIELKGQVTSAVPVKGGAIVAADGARLVKVTPNGRRESVAGTDAVPFRLTPDADGGVVFMDRPTKDTAKIRRIGSGDLRAPDVRTARPVTLGEGPLTGIGITRGAAGEIFLTGAVRQASGRLPESVHRLAGTPKDARVTTLGTAVVTKTAWADGKDSRIKADEASGARPAAIDLTVLDTGKKASFVVEPDAASSKDAAKGRMLSPALVAPAGGRRAEGGVGVAANSPTDPVDADRTCSVPRGDPRNQAMQPKPRQVEWAVDQAIMGTLNQHISRPANWKNLGMPAYQPQTLFPRPALVGGGRVPAQVMLGVTAQESNMWQASRHAVPGVTSNPLIGNFYGILYYDKVEANDWDIDWSKADCGYGVTQVTDHMRMAGREDGRPAAWPYDKQRAVALDYTANIAAGLQILSDKWNQTRSAGLIVNNGDWSKMENWFFALWAYNSGFYPDKGDGSPWGVGWANNPANPEWDAGRTPFMEFSYADAAHPENWPYQEKVLGFAGHPLEALESPGVLVSGFRAAWWTNADYRIDVKPDEDLFCTSANSCDPGKIGDGAKNEPGAGPCTRLDYMCWWHQPVTWKDCGAGECGYELVRFDSTYAEQADGIAYPPNCALQASDTTTSKGNAAPPGAMIIDDIPDGTPAIRPGCGRPWANAGSFTLTFSGSGSHYPSKVDTHQIGGGFGGHFYFSHTRKHNEALTSKLKVTGTWTLGQARNEWSRIAVHLPDHGAHTQQAKYEIDTGSGTFGRVRYINQHRLANNWVSLGVFQLNGVPRVRLSTPTDDGDGSADVAWDAVAFQTLPRKPQHIVAVLGDSYASGEGAGNYYAETDSDHGKDQWNACRRSKNAWGRKVVLPGTSSSLGALADTWSGTAELGFVACSGAKTSNVWDEEYDQHQQEHRIGQYHEHKQARSGVLDHNTTLVMLTLGGNDGDGFTDVLVKCAEIIPECTDDPDFLPTYKGVADEMIVNLRNTLEDIKVKAPYAQIVLMGYPELLSRTVKCTGSWYIDMQEVAAIAELVNYLNGKQKEMADALRNGGLANVEYANPVNAFVGHGGCDTPEWINKVVIGPIGDGDFHVGDPAAHACTPAWLGGGCISRESFHPNADGTTGYANVMRTRLDEIGYTGS